MDWKKLKTEYITTDTSYRKLATKYGISHIQIGRVAKEEEWVKAKKQYDDKTFTKSIKKAEEKAIDYKSTLYNLAYKVVSQLDEMTDNHSIEDLALAGIKPRDITGAIKDLEDALHVKSATDIKEQEARIANLQKQAEADEDGSKNVTININGGDGSWQE